MQLVISHNSDHTIVRQSLNSELALHLDNNGQCTVESSTEGPIAVFALRKPRMEHDLNELTDLLKNALIKHGLWARQHPV